MHTPAPTLIACPLCSHPPHLICRPSCVRGVRSGRWMIITDSICPHFDTWLVGNAADTPDPLVTRWTEWAVAEAAKRSTARGHTTDQAAAFLAALQPSRYTPRA